MVRVLKFRVLGCQDVDSCFSIKVERMPKRANSKAAPSPTGPPPRMITGALLSRLSAIAASSHLALHPAHAAQPTFEIAGLAVHPGLGQLVGENQEPLFPDGVDDHLGHVLRFLDRPEDS